MMHASVLWYCTVQPTHPLSTRHASVLDESQDVARLIRHDILIGRAKMAKRAEMGRRSVEDIGKREEDIAKRLRHGTGRDGQSEEEGEIWRSR